MQNSPFLSVVIPTYNVEKYIETTLGSIIAQAFFDYEIIIVDDGSTDNTVEKCRNFKVNNPTLNIEVYQMNHGGVSKARNIGIAKAKGKYLHFMDSDDEIMPDMYNLFYTLSEQHDYELIIGAVDIIKSTGTIVQTIRNDIKCLNKAHLVKWLRDISVADKDWMLNVVWNKWFRRDIILKKELKYKNICPGEDYEFVMQYLALCDSVYICSKPIYKYYQRGTASLLTRRYSHLSQIERRKVNWDTTQSTLASIGVFNPTFLIAEGISLYSAIYGDMHTDGNKSMMLKDYFKLNQYGCVSLYFKSRKTLMNSIIGVVFASKCTAFIQCYFIIKQSLEKLKA